MKVTAQKLGSTLLLDLAGRLTVGGGAGALYEAASRFQQPGVSDIVLNFENVEQIDCSGIGELVRLYNRVQKAGGSVGLIKVEPRQKCLLEVMRLLTAFRLFESVEEALVTLTLSSRPRSPARVVGDSSVGNGRGRLEASSPPERLFSRPRPPSLGWVRRVRALLFPVGIGPSSEPR